MRDRAAAFAARRWALPREGVGIHLRPLTGGLESAVATVTVTSPPPDAVSRRFVVKQLRGALRRERAVYELLWTHLDRPPAVQLLGAESADDREFLFLEQVDAVSAWPWSDTAVAAAVCRVLAGLHEAEALPTALFDWGYDIELARSAQETLAAARTARDDGGERYWRRLGDLRRVVGALPAIRARLESRRAIIHGDMHPGNVIVRREAGELHVALIDWGRARVGSPLEDVASWLHSLGCWEPEARRRHDTLLRAYLESRAMPQRVTADLRREYWFASASNGLSGAIRYHLAVLSDPRSTASMRAHSRRAVAEWERVIRRAAALVSASRAGRT